MTAMICTCDKCHIIFDAEFLPANCPRCGAEELDRWVIAKVIIGPAVRPATDKEIKWFVSVRKELVGEMAEKALKEEHILSLRDSIARLDQYDLSDDEFNLGLMLLHELNTSRYLVPILNYFLEGSKKALSCYKDVRKVFTRKINEERAELRATGRQEPWSIGLIADGEHVPRKGLDDYGPTLAVLYRFRAKDQLHTPNLGNIRRIDLETVAARPGTGYKAFLSDWKRDCLAVPEADPFSDLLF